MEMKDRLSAINSLLANPPAEIGFSAEEIEEIVQGENLRDHLETINEGFYLDKLLAALGWWFGLGHILTYAPFAFAENWTQSARDCEEWKINSRRQEIMRLHAIAFEARCLGEDASPDPTGLELVKRYAELTEYIRTLVERDFPGVDFGQSPKAA